MFTDFDHVLLALSGVLTVLLLGVVSEVLTRRRRTRSAEGHIGEALLGLTAPHAEDGERLAGTELLTLVCRDLVPVLLRYPDESVRLEPGGAVHPFAGAPARRSPPGPARQEAPATLLALVFAELNNFRDLIDRRGEDYDKVAAAANLAALALGTRAALSPRLHRFNRPRQQLLDIALQATTYIHSVDTTGQAELIEERREGRPLGELGPQITSWAEVEADGADRHRAQVRRVYSLRLESRTDPPISRPALVGISPRPPFLVAQERRYAWRPWSIHEGGTRRMRLFELLGTALLGLGWLLALGALLGRPTEPVPAAGPPGSPPPQVPPGGVAP